MKFVILGIALAVLVLAYAGLVLALRRGGVRRKEYSRALDDQQSMADVLNDIELAVVDYLDPLKGEAAVLAGDVLKRVQTERQTRYDRNRNNKNSKVNA